MKYLIYIIIICLSIIYGCNSNNYQIPLVNENNAEIIDCVDLLTKANQESVLFYDEDIVDSIYVIKLESIDEALFGYIHRLQIGDNYIYILDHNKRVIIFDLDGKYIKTIFTGNGPGEIYSPDCISYNKYTHEFLIFQFKTVYKYTETGEYLTAIDIPFYIQDCMPFKNGYIFFQEFSQNKAQKNLFITTDFGFNITNISSLSKQYPSVYPSFLLNKNNENIMFSRCCDNNIYFFNDTSFYVKYKLELGELENVVDENEVYYDYKKYSQIKNKYEINGCFAENDKFQSFVLFRENKPYVFFRNKHSGKMIVGINNFPLKSSLGFCLICGNPYGTYHNYFINVLSYENLPYRPLLDYIIPENHISQEDVEKIKNLKEDDNPLVILYTLKGLE
ncbi:MAG: 6-bladed beta-propeller [Bacteroidales bacterium]|nr:6-bladed beta-propeller [Bacteroidales bacterium]